MNAQPLRSAATAPANLNEETKEDPGRELTESSSDKEESAAADENANQSQRSAHQRQRGRRTQQQQRATNLRRSVHMNNEAACRMSTVERQELCTICMENVDESVRAKLDCCNHVYCATCIRRWVD